MKQLWVSFIFAFKDCIRKRAFLMSTIFMLVAVLGMCLAAYFQGIKIKHGGKGSPTAITAEDHIVEDAMDDANRKICYYIDPQNLIMEGITSLQTKMPDVTFIQGSESSIGLYQQRIAADRRISMILVYESEQEDEMLLPEITITNRDLMSGLNENEVREILSRKYISNLLTNKGVQNDLTALLEISLSSEMTLSSSLNMGGILLSLMIALLILLAAYFYGRQLALSAAQERSGRILESLLVSCKPSRILAGRMLALGVVSLLQFTLVFAFAIGCVRIFVPAGFQIAGLKVTLDMVNFKRALALILYFLMGYALYALLIALTGTLAGKVEETGPAARPIVMLSVVSLIFGCILGMDLVGGNGFMRFLGTYLPMISPFYMPFRILSESVSFVECMISMILLGITILMIAYMTMAVYRRSIMETSVKVTLKDLIRSGGKW